MRYVEATLHPESVVEDLRAGELSRTSVEALQDNHSAIYGHLVRQVVDQMSQLAEPPPFEDRVMLSHLLDQPLDPSVDGGFVARMQASYVQDAQPETPAQTSPRARIQSPDLATGSLSDAQGVAARRSRQTSN